MELRQGWQGDLRSADRHRCTHRRVEHPCRHDDPRTGLALNQDDIGPGPLLRIESPDRTAVKGVPAVVDRHFLPDTGTINPRWLSGENHGCSPVPTAAGSVPQRCTA